MDNIIFPIEFSKFSIKADFATFTFAWIFEFFGTPCIILGQFTSVFFFTKFPTCQSYIIIQMEQYLNNDFTTSSEDSSGAAMLYKSVMISLHIMLIPFIPKLSLLTSGADSNQTEKATTYDPSGHICQTPQSPQSRSKSKNNSLS